MLIQVWEEERRRISRELHDDLGQRLALLEMQIDRLEQKCASQDIVMGWRTLRQSVGEMDRDLHRMCFELHPVVLDQLGLAAALKSFCREFSEYSGVQATFVSENVPRNLPGKVSLCLFRVVQEALHNVSTHAKAREATVTLRGTAGGLEVTIDDSGIGFDAAAALARGGLGLVSMKERVLGVGGRYSVESSGMGTVVRAVVPGVRES